MSGLPFQIDWLGLPLYIGTPLLYLFTVKGWDPTDESYYQYLVSKSRLFPAGSAKAVFWIFWGIFYPLTGAAAYVFWHEAATIGEGTYQVGLAMYWLQLFIGFLWIWLFKYHSMYWAARAGLIITVSLLTLAGSIGFFVCTVIAGETFSAIVSGVLSLWLLYALIMTIRMVTIGPMPGLQTAGPMTVMPEFEQRTMGYEGGTQSLPPQQQQPPPQQYAYEQSNISNSAATSRNQFSPSKATPWIHSFSQQQQAAQSIDPSQLQMPSFNNIYDTTLSASGTAANKKTM